MDGRIMDNNKRFHILNLKASVDLFMIAEQVLGMNKKGKRYFCPLCQPQGGKTPDLQIYSNGFKCFKCGASGDVYSLLMDMGGMTFTEAVEALENETRIFAGDNSERYKQTTPQQQKPEPKPEKSQEAVEALNRFVAMCEPPVKAMIFFERRRISAETVKKLNMRFCGNQYHNIMAEMKRIYSMEVLIESGLCSKEGTLSFQYYYQRKAGFLVIPYMADGTVEYLKVRPACEKEAAAKLGLIRFMNLHGTVPCLYNIDALKKPGTIIICEGESDTWAAVEMGDSAVGIPGSNGFKREWVDLFQGHQVVIAADGDDAGTKSAEAISKMFIDAGQPMPELMQAPEGHDLAQMHMKYEEKK